MKPGKRTTDALEMAEVVMDAHPHLRVLVDAAISRLRRASDLRKARIARALTQADLARKSGLSQTTIGRIERSETTVPSPETLRRLAKALNLDPAAFMPH